MYKSGHRAICFSQLCCNLITQFPSTMPPVRRISFGPVRRLSFGSRSRSSAICVVCVKVFPRTARQWDSNLDVSPVRYGSSGRSRSSTSTSVEEEEEKRVQQGFTIRIPPRIHRIYMRPLPCRLHCPSCRWHIRPLSTLSEVRKMFTLQKNQEEKTFPQREWDRQGKHLQHRFDDYAPRRYPRDI